ncbi:MAG TPA: hypothetical protein PLH19_06675 [Anaerolineae bacterium]|nr:hypothetical protein [Anaerolineae bacterium]HQH38205.1 hypothetical protein [Anaerolineae bacterium]
MDTEPIINTHADLMPVHPPWDGWELLPVVAVIGGAWAFGALLQSAAWPPLLAALVLVLGGWLPFWRALMLTPWATSLALWRTWEREENLPRWPYLQPGTPGAALHRTLRQARSWWRVVGRTALAAPLRAAALAFIVSVLAAMVVGRDALLLTLLMAAWTEMAVLWHGGRGDAGSIWTAGALVGLPWLLGASLGGTALTQPVLSALTLVVLAGFYAHPSPLAAIGPLLAACFLIWQGHFIATGGILLLALPGWMALLYHPPVHAYRRTVAPWLLGMIVLMAWAL